MGIEAYSTTAGSNTAISGISVAENCPIANWNNAFRQFMADQRAQWNDAEWFEYGDGDAGATVSYASATSFTVAGVDVTAAYHIGRRVKIVASTPGTIYGTISNSTFSTNTTVTVVWDSGSLSNEAITVYLGATSAINSSLPTVIASSQTIKSTDAGATGPILTLQHDSASPAASDVVGTITFNADDDGGAADSVAAINVDYNTVTAGAEDATLNLRTMRAGARSTRMSVAAGAYMAGATGGDKGAGTLNATTLYQGGVAVNPKISAAKLVHRANDGSNGGTSVADTWTKRTLTEDTDADGIVSVASSVFTLGAGTYIIDFAGAFSGGSGDSDAALRIRNTSDSTTAGISTNTGTMFAAAENGLASGSCIVTIAGSKNFELQYYHTVAVSNVGLGSPINSGEDEIYAWVKILKIA